MSQNSVVHIESQGASFMTPGFPNNPGKGSCTWNITTFGGKYIRLQFVKLYPSCVNITLISGIGEVIREEICAPETIYSNGSSLIIKYTSMNDQERQRGFLASFEQVDAIPLASACSSNSERPILLAGPSGVLASYKYPRRYPSGAYCVWKIEVPFTKKVELSFDTFHLQSSERCYNDYVQVYDGDSYSTRVSLGKFCGTSIPSNLSSTANKMVVTFRSDPTVSFTVGLWPGFKATFKAVDNTGE